MLRKFISICLLLFLPYFVFAEDTTSLSQTERITYFGSIIVVNKDASIDITETLVIYAHGNQIKRGIVRWLPTRYVDSYNIARHTNYQIRSIELNNVSVPYHTEYKNNQYVIYIGDANVLLEPGTYTYRIVYHINNAINFFKDGSELYWNITGNGWTFPIEKVDVKVQLPAEANIMNYYGYTGKLGDKGRNYIARKKTENQVIFISTRSLAPGEGFTVAVSWPKGIVIKPSFMTQLRQQLNPGSYILLFLNALVFGYLFTMWYRHGRDPKTGTIIPLFQPPENLSPEAIRFIRRMGFDMKSFSAATVSLATQGIAKMKNTDNTFTLTKVSDEVGRLPTEEKNLLKNLFSSGSTIDLQRANYKIISKAKNDLHRDLKHQFQNTYFVTNTKYLVVSVVLTLIGFIAAINFAEDKGSAFFAIAWLSIWTFGCCMLLATAIKSVQQFLLEKSVLSFLAMMFSSLFLIPFLLGEIVGFYALSDAIPFFTLPLLFVLVVMNVVFYYLFRTPTPLGRKVLDQIEGFRMYLATTEQNRLELLNPPKQTPEMFEKLLPYAIALDVENKWGENFNRLLKEAGQEPSQYHPVWYSGKTPWGASTAALPVVIGTALASSLASASVSSSSSASGGGGSSGGGGGGGGGSGW